MYQSLERMVVDFGREYYGLDEYQVAILVQQVRDGDVSAVLKAYEKEIKVSCVRIDGAIWLTSKWMIHARCINVFDFSHNLNQHYREVFLTLSNSALYQNPLRNAVAGKNIIIIHPSVILRHITDTSIIISLFSYSFLSVIDGWIRIYTSYFGHRLSLGDLIRTLLIQVQKTKVDVDLAMAALDKLLKSNELNFAFLGKHTVLFGSLILHLGTIGRMYSIMPGYTVQPSHP